MQTTNSRVVRTEFAAAIAQIASERKITTESIYTAIKQALVSAYRKQYGDLEEEAHYFVELNEDNGESRIFKAPATKVDEETGEVLEWDETKSKDVTPAGFGRIAAQTAKQVILQKIRESEKDQIISEYEDRIGEIITAQILRMDGRKVVLDLGRGQGLMPPEEQMRGEFYKVNTRITVFIKEIRETHRGQAIIVSRADEQLVVKLFEREVPEVQTGSVKIELIAREAGVRTKLAVRSTQDGVDPVGSCVGQRGVRVQEVIRELNNEKLDIIPWTDDKRLLLQGALAPAEGLQITINEEDSLVEVVAPDDQLSLAIGRGGQNVRLAAKLTNFKITIKSADGTVESAVTGEEEYEIDTFEGVTPETRAFLVDNKLTTLGDLARFQNKWVESEELEADQKEMLTKLVEEFIARDEEINLLRQQQ
ncbi:MAG: transcription termination/antitermination protein NusA [Candidatus Pacebacteria bacterium]|nr:transcription termination/antitermination protein NusA [Candidatus Paceibacterota bacterium]PIR63667.1 MAG: transcription termination/antitermination protein NusA [Candidatus Pacebacteria bacterium CG10_big_fil_rev_8_21_14_0_10_40_26]PIZ78770.1 MAG: transcription termination/antitermination protein NusA [Candidatus Pacebacteria bacterium CG_4_10_14_0_2_um_filter_40_20]PJA68379.1 MAG: transcription termination/antitermination protein NusA [Candidatus Pacebacteria bacterium CG_4_9_14_3_um_filte